MERFDQENLPQLYNRVAAMDPMLGQILEQYGYPPVWVRPNNFETLVLTILEQQVSLASAYAAYQQLRSRILITPENLLQLPDAVLRSCYFSRQKIVYVRELARAVLNGKVQLEDFEKLPDDQVRAELKLLKGIGDWTVDIYLIHALRRTDVFPAGDLALVNAMKMVYGDKELSKEILLEKAAAWKPFRSMATMLFWHYYIRKKNIRLLH